MLISIRELYQIASGGSQCRIAIALAIWYNIGMTKASVAIKIHMLYVKFRQLHNVLQIRWSEN